MEGLLVKGRKDMKPLLLKAGLALALSLAGYLFSQMRSRQAADRRRLPPADEVEDGGRKAGGGIKDELRIMKFEEFSPKFMGGTATSAFAALSPLSRSSGDEQGYLLPEFNELVRKEIELSGKDSDTPSTRTSTPRKLENKEVPWMEQEIATLKNLVQSLQERERNLEFQLLEYYGLKEQETAVRELENRLKINSVEAKLFNLKIESLQADNQRLAAQVSDYSRVMAELESARAKIKLLKRKLRSDAEQVKEKVAALHQRVTELKASECAERERDKELEKSLMRLKDLEDEIVDLKEENSRLEKEILDLTKKMESSQMPASSPASPEATEVLEEANSLRKRNEELTKEIEQLQMDRCGDVEELVYLRWVNACLRYELRNYQPPEGITVAKDLNKTLSPKSEEKAKQLILEYANSGNDEKLLMDFDSEYCSSSQASSLTEIGELDDTSSSTKNSSHSSKSKFFSKLKKLVLGKDNHSNRLSTSDGAQTSCGNSERRASISNRSFDDMMGSDSCSVTSCITMDHVPGNQLAVMDSKADDHCQNKAPWAHSLSKKSFDAHKLSDLSPDEARAGRRERCKSDVGSSHGYKRFILGERSSISSAQSLQIDCESESVDSPEKMELRKFANALKNTGLSPQFRRRSESFSMY